MTPETSIKEKPSMDDYKIFCQVGARIVATLSMKGELTIHHDHFKDDENFDLTNFIKAFELWSKKKYISHRSQRGLNQKTIDQLNNFQTNLKE
jgi:hypothetical protein